MDNAQFGPSTRVGVDIVEIERVARSLVRHGDRFLRRVFTAGELDYCRGRVPALAARFAAKEAIFKALGTGATGVGWREVEVVRAESGEPSVRLHGRALARSQQLGITWFAISLSHSRVHAIACVVASRNPDEPSKQQVQT